MSHTETTNLTEDARGAEYRLPDQAVETDESTRRYIAGLLEEKRQAEVVGDASKIADIDAELTRVGARAKTPAKRSSKR